MHERAEPAEPQSLPPNFEELAKIRQEFEGLMLRYKFGIDEMMTKINILKEESAHLHDYTPIEHVEWRLKSPASILRKAARKGAPVSIDGIADRLHDIAGIRITCSFISDTYRILDMLAAQHDVSVLEVRDYIKTPKVNGYQSLHMVVEVPVFLSATTHQVKVEVQIRTIAMDFWASLEHKIYYKYDGDVPQDLLDKLRDAAETASRLDLTMEHLHADVKALDVGTGQGAGAGGAGADAGAGTPGGAGAGAGAGGGVAGVAASASAADSRSPNRADLPDSLLRIFWADAERLDAGPGPDAGSDSGAHADSV